MSYILEALKKLERKRRQEETRPTLTLEDSPSPETPIRPLWIYLVALGLILNAGLFFWWLFHPVSAPTPVPAGAPAPRAASPKTASPASADREDRSVFPPKKEPVPEPTTVTAKAPVLGQRPASPPAAEPAPSAGPHKTSPPPPPIEKAPAPTPLKASPQTPPVDRIEASPPVKTPAPAAQVEKTPGSEPAKKTSTTPMKKEILRDSRVYNLNELPADVRNALPPLKISAHVYSPDPSSRLAQVNGQMVQQGQDLIEGIKVEEILPRGIIFRFQGYRFELGIQ